MPLREYQPGTSPKPRSETFVEDCQRRAAELQQAHTEWKAAQEQGDTHGFSSAWLRSHKHTWLAKWIYHYNALPDLLALCPAEVSADIERKVPMTPEVIQAQFVAAHGEWLKTGDGAPFDRPWLRAHYSGLDKYLSDKELWDETLAALPATIRANFKYVLPPPEYTLDSAIAKLRLAHSVWQQLDPVIRPLFNSDWLKHNKFSGLERYVRNHYGDFGMVAHLAGEEVGRDFHDQFTYNEQIVLDLLRQAYYVWRNEDPATRGKLNTGWLRKHHYMNIYKWAQQEYPGGFENLLQQLPLFMREDLEETA